MGKKLLGGKKCRILFLVICKNYRGSSNVQNSSFPNVLEGIEDEYDRMDGVEVLWEEHWVFVSRVEEFNVQQDLNLK